MRGAADVRTERRREVLRMNHAHLDPVRRALRASSLTDPPAPWRCVGRFAIGGLISVGFSRNDEWLVVSSHQGIGIIDCITGVKIARDSDIDGYPDKYLEVIGIGPLAHERIATAGIHGGGLPLTTPDGWAIEVITLDWPEQEVFLMEPGNDLYGAISGKPSNHHRVATEATLRATGFSYSGSTLVLATSSDVVIHSRHEQAD